MVVVIGLASAAASCGPRPVPVVTFAPRFPDLIMPIVPPGLAPVSTVHAHDEAWRTLQSGSLDDAQRRFAAILKQSPQFFPSATGLGLLEFVRKDYPRAVRHFDEALAFDADYLPALLGKGDALIAAERIGEAVVALERVVALDATRTDIRERIGVLRFRGTQETIARAQQLERDRKWPEAKLAYEAAVALSPESAFLVRGLAEVSAQTGDRAAAVGHLRRALVLDPSDGSGFGRLAGLLEELGNDTEALSVLTALNEREPSPATEARMDAMRERIALARLPDQYRNIGQASIVTRGQLASLIGVRLRTLLDVLPDSAAVVVTDVRQHWAETWIGAVTRRGVVEPFPNHTFQPDAVLTRSDLASAVGVLLRALGSRQAAWWQQWQQRRIAFTDIDPRHLSYPAASLAVSADVLPVAEGRAFRPMRPVDGAEAVQAVDRLVDLAAKAGLAPSRAGR
jgi:tetratricopeptide (TPR) repeat protein